MIRRPPRSTRVRSSAASDVYKRQHVLGEIARPRCGFEMRSTTVGSASDSEPGGIVESPALTELFTRPQFSIPQAEKERLLLGELTQMVSMHRSACSPYRRITDVVGETPQTYESLAQLPYLPVALFKTHQLSSIPTEQVFKVMTSSGTTGQAVSSCLLYTSPSPRDR